MTVHAAKGLEFSYVFLCGMNEGIFPSRKVRTIQGAEEERRLAFVALTRAEKKLYLPEDNSSIIFPIGQRVKHAIFGTGTILDGDMEKAAMSCNSMRWKRPGGFHSEQSWSVAENHVWTYLLCTYRHLSLPACGFSTPCPSPDVA